ncbi:hypothetical protein NIES25_06500 [Nostoc linckia NIES-25]|nr:hypothetical protein NIES25_06500 [Nostoc linckia NIES-25]
MGNGEMREMATPKGKGERARGKGKIPYVPFPPFPFPFSLPEGFCLMPHPQLPQMQKNSY